MVWLALVQPTLATRIVDSKSLTSLGTGKYIMDRVSPPPPPPNLYSPFWPLKTSFRYKVCCCRYIVTWRTILNQNVFVHVYQAQEFLRTSLLLSFRPVVVFKSGGPLALSRVQFRVSGPAQWAHVVGINRLRAEVVQAQAIVILQGFYDDRVLA